MPCYKFVYTNWKQKCGGGVGTYLKEELDFKIHEDLNRLNAIPELNNYGQKSGLQILGTHWWACGYNAPKTYKVQEKTCT